MGFGSCAPLGPYDKGYEEAQRRIEDETPEPTVAEKLAAAQATAHRALDAAERSWYAYAGMIDVGPDRTLAFSVYEAVRMARRA